MPNPWFNFKQFKIWQKESAFKVGTDSVLLGAWCDVGSAQNILDVGTGTGLLALMTAQRSKARITAIEPDSISATEAILNVNNSQWNDRIDVLNVSLQEYASSAAMKFDLIISNPPYFSNSLTNNDNRISAARHNYMLNTSQLLKYSEFLLSNSGRICLVLPYVEGNLLIAEASDYKLYCTRILKIKPLPGKPVKRILLELSRTKSIPDAGFLIIERGPRHEYTHEYRSLTKDFYLDF